MIEIRPLRSDEIASVVNLVPDGNAEPNWNDVLAVVQDGEIVMLLGAQIRLHVEPAYCKKGHNAAALLGLGHIDGYMRRWAQNTGLTGYEFFVGDDHPEFQLFIHNNLPVTPGKERAGLYFMRSFKVSDGQPDPIV